MSNSNLFRIIVTLATPNQIVIMNAKGFLFGLFLLISINLFSQTSPATVKKKLFFEKVYLHLDREYFYAGEDIWFKAYLLNAQGNQLLPTSNNLYVELINPGYDIDERKVIRLDNGVGNGDFKLGDSIPSGTYLIRAYTNWMLNFGDNFIFEKKITVASSELDKLGSAGAAVAKPSSEIKPDFTSEIIRFFPEGGSMVEGVTGVLSFKAETAGKGIKVKGEILSAGEVIAAFESNDLGMGSFMMRPEAGATYQVKGTYNNLPFTAKLPEALPRGFSMHVLTDSIKTNVIISTNEASLADFKDKPFEIKVRHTGITYYTKSISLQSVVTRIIIPNTELPEGIAAVTLTDNQLRPHCERLVFINKGVEVDKVVLNTNKAVFRSREATTISVKATDNLGRPVKANLSMAVVDAGIIPENHSNIISYIKLESELRGKIEKPENYFNPANSDRFKQLDLLLMTQGWRDFIWKRLKDTVLTISHINETGFTVSGTVKDKSGKTPIAGANVTLFATGAKGQKLLGETTDSQGKYYFDNMNLEGSQSIKLVSADGKGKKSGMIFMDSLYLKPLAVKPFIIKTDELPGFNVFKTTQKSRLQEMKQFDLLDTIALKEIAIKASKTVRLFDQNVTSFGYPDQSFNITDKDEKDYQNLRHYLLTNVNGATPDSNMDRNGVLFSSSGKLVYPRFIVDRREDLFERMDYYELRMKDVQRIVVRHMIGSFQNSQDSTMSAPAIVPGITDVYLVYLTLKPSAFGRAEPSLLNTRVNGYYQHRVFYEPPYPQNINSTKKDLRTTIYWKPYLTTDDKGEAVVRFYNADPKTKVRVVVEGVNNNGMPVVGELYYDLK